MKTTATSPFLVPRTCTTLDENGKRRAGAALTEFRDTQAYVLLGDPGAGKTRCFEQEATTTGGHYVRARNFAALDPSPALAGKTLFIDGLDEMRTGGGDGRTPLDHIRRHLGRLGHPRFRLSCREADWYGDSDRAALQEAAPGGVLRVLHLDLLDEDDIALLLQHNFGIADAPGFIRQAKRHGLDDLLRNPQALELLAQAAGGGTWPESRYQTYDLACRQLVRETNPEHRNARRERAPAVDALLQAAGYLCAVQVLAGIAGYALDDDAADTQHALWRELTPPQPLPLPTALASNLFRRDDAEQQRIPIHRSIAEYLGAHHLAALIDTQGLPLGRIVALLAGSDGGILPDLRGLAAWLAVHCRAARADLIARDPLGIVLYGDVRNFPTEDKLGLFDALRSEAERYPHFRFEDWTAAPFGALATRDMLPTFLEMIGSPSRATSDLALLDCVLDTLRHGPTLDELANEHELQRLAALLDSVVRDPDYPSGIRQSALKVLLRDPRRNVARLLALAGEVQVGHVEDGYDELLGRLLLELFPEFITISSVFDFLHPAKKENFLGLHHIFWRRQLVRQTPPDALPVLLDEWVKRRPALLESIDHFAASDIAGQLLAEALQIHGDLIDDTRLFHWLSAGFNKYGNPHLEDRHRKQVADWLSERPGRYKAVLQLEMHQLHANGQLNHGVFNSLARLYGAEGPADLVSWCLDRVQIEAATELKEYFFLLAVVELVRRGGEQWLSLKALDELAPWIIRHPEFEHTLAPFVSCAVNDWRKNDAIHQRTAEEHRQRRFEEWRNHVREHVDAVREGRAYPQILHQLANVYLHPSFDIDDATPPQRLSTFLGAETALIKAALAGFCRTLERDDLPSVGEIVALDLKGEMHLIREPCLVGAELLFRDAPTTVRQLNDDTVSTLLAFQLTGGFGEEPEWFSALIRERPELAAQVYVAYALPLLRKGKSHLRGIWLLMRSRKHAALASRVLADLLGAFPLRATHAQLSRILVPMLQAALRLCDRPGLANIIATRLALCSMGAAQRVHWLACGLMVSPTDYEEPLAAHVARSKPLRAQLGAFLHDSEERNGPAMRLPASAQALLIEMLAPDSPPERPAGGHWVTSAMHTADEVHALIDALGGNPSDSAQQQLERLLNLPQLAAWHHRLQRAAHTQRIARRKAGARRPEPIDVCRTLANREPANVADLAALSAAYLRDLAKQIRHGNTNDYRQYWSYDAKGRPERPKPENDCRDMLLSDLKERLGRLGIDAIKEGYYAEDKRADIRVSFGGASRFNVPVEIKKDCHADLWRALREQLVERYTRDPGAGGFGIYLVFWFGGSHMPLPQVGRKPRSAAELEEGLRAALTPDEARQIAVIVIDCALPPADKP